MAAGVHAVAGRLDVRAQVKVLFPNGQVARQGPGLWRGERDR